MDKQELRKLIAIWFEEDIRDGDHTSLSCIPPTQMGCQQLIIKDTGVLAGVEVAKEIINYFDPECRVEQFLEDGALVMELQDEVAAQYARRRSVDKALEKMIREEFCLTCRVRIDASGDEKARLQEIARRRQEEETALAETLKKLTSAPEKKKEPSRHIFGGGIPPVLFLQPADCNDFNTDHFI